MGVRGEVGSYSARPQCWEELILRLVLLKSAPIILVFPSNERISTTVHRFPDSSSTRRTRRRSNRGSKLLAIRCSSRKGIAKTESLCVTEFTMRRRIVGYRRKDHSPVRSCPHRIFRTPTMVSATSWLFLNCE